MAFYKYELKTTINFLLDTLLLLTTFVGIKERVKYMQDIPTHFVTSQEQKYKYYKKVHLIFDTHKNVLH